VRVQLVCVLTGITATAAAAEGAAHVLLLHPSSQSSQGFRHYSNRHRSKVFRLTSSRTSSRKHTKTTLQAYSYPTHRGPFHLGIVTAGLWTSVPIANFSAVIAADLAASVAPHSAAAALACKCPQNHSLATIMCCRAAFTDRAPLCCRPPPALSWINPQLWTHLQALLGFLKACWALLPEFVSPSLSQATQRLCLVLGASLVMVVLVSTIDSGWLYLYLLNTRRVAA
jgi:hypothetical protein